MAEQEKQLDQLLDSLLANYANAEPRPGLETRLLATVREARTSSTRSWHIWQWLLAGTGVVAMAVAVSAVYYSRLAELPPPPRIQVTGPPTLLPVVRASGQGAKPRRQKSRVESVTLVADVGPRQEVFPTLVPLSEQERLLLRYLAGTPRDEIVSHAHEDEPIEKTEPFRPESQRINGAEVFSTR